jgi:hypothetical protein
MLTPFSGVVSDFGYLLHRGPDPLLMLSATLPALASLILLTPDDGDPGLTEVTSLEFFV